MTFKFVMRSFALVAAVGISGGASAGLISYTGVELLTAPNVSFPTIAPITSGSSIQFTSSARPNNAALIQFDLIPAGTISGPTTLRISGNFTSLSGDQDQAFGLSDGDNVGAGGVFDSVQTFTISTTLASGPAYAAQTNFESGNSTGVTLGTFNLDVLFNLNAAGITSITPTATQGGATSTHTSNVGTALNTALPLSLFLFGQSTGEDYQLNSLEVEASFINGEPDPDGSVPAPSILALLAAGLIGLGGARRRSRHGNAD